MYRHIYKQIISFIFILFSLTVNAQQHKLVDSLDNKLRQFSLKNRAPVLFIHFDKTVYSNNDNVWFTAYLINAADFGYYNTLSVALINDDDRSIVLENKFIIKAGLAFGSTIIPNAAPPGNYSFVATTNRLKNGKSEVVFTQPVTIKSEEEEDFNGSLIAVDTSVSLSIQKVKLITEFKHKQNNEPIPEVQISYYMGNSLHPIIKGFGQTFAGQYDFSIPTKQLIPGNNALHVLLWYKNKSKDISMVLPAPPQAASVRFFPEGGNMVNDQQNVVGIEIKTIAGTPLKATGILYQDATAIGKIETSSYGMGKFIISPIAGSKYYIKLNSIIQKDTSYKLPQPVFTGPAVMVKQALANDTLNVIIGNNKPGKFYLVVHNYKQLFFTVPINLINPDKTQRLKIFLGDVPKGLNQLTVIDSLGRPFAERIFFAHYNQKTQLQITPNERQYGTRQKVTVSLKLNTPVDDMALVSIACVQANRIEIKKQNDIESYLYLKNDLGELPLKDNYIGTDDADKQYLESLLLIKGWRRYKWTDVLKIKATDTLQKYTDVTIKGNVVMADNNNAIKKPVALININNPIKEITTTQAGYFTFSNEDMRAKFGKKASFIIKDPNPKNYSIHLVDPYYITNQLLSTQLQPKQYMEKGQENTRYMQVPDNEHAIHIKEVNITGGDANSFYGKDGKDNEGKYRFSTLTLEVHNEGNYGKAFLIKTYETTAPVTSYKIQLNGIYSSQEFYTVDYEKNSQQDGYLSTLYWKNALKISSKQNTEVSFYTGDIAGKFKIIVQGITNNDVVYGETTFNVVK